MQNFIDGERCGLEMLSTPTERTKSSARTFQLERLFYRVEKEIDVAVRRGVQGGGTCC